MSRAPSGAGNRTGHEAPDRAALRRFGLTTGLVLIGLLGLALPLLRHHAIPRWPYYPGVALVALGLAVPQSLGPVHRAWMAVGGVLGWINTRIILSVVFVVILTPLGLLLRLFGKDAIGRRLDRRAASYRVESQALGRERMKEPF